MTSYYVHAVCSTIMPFLNTSQHSAHRLSVIHFNDPFKRKIKRYTGFKNKGLHTGIQKIFFDLSLVKGPYLSKA